MNKTQNGMDRMSLPPNNSEDSVMTTRRTEKAKTEKERTESRHAGTNGNAHG